MQQQITGKSGTETEKETLVINGDSVAVVFMDGEDKTKRLTRLRIFKDVDEMKSGKTALVEINFSSAFRMRLFWFINIQCFAEVWKPLFGYSVYIEKNKNGH